MEGIEKQLSDLEAKSTSTAAKIAHMTGQKRCLLLINDPAKLSSAIAWINSHSLAFYDLVVVIKAEELSAPVMLKITKLKEQAIPPFFQPLAETLFNNLNPSSLTLSAIPPLELTATTTSLLRNQIDLVVIVGCHCLSRGEYENVAEFKPLVEEIVLKEAIQPVILFK